ncbi:Tmem247 [Columba guinea]|nr:Tmem247 [Columba guinea]
MEELEENQEDINLTLQEAQNDNKKQQRKKMQGAIRDMTTSSLISESMAHLDMKGGTSALQSEVSSSAEELEQLCDKQDTAADIELERMRWDFVLAKLKYEHEDNEKQRLHEERMEQIHQQAVKRSSYNTGYFQQRKGEESSNICMIGVIIQAKLATSVGKRIEVFKSRIGMKDWVGKA